MVYTTNTFFFSSSFCWSHHKDQTKTFPLLLNSKFLDFETLRHENVSYRQGPYRIRIDTAADRIVQAIVPGRRCKRSAGHCMVPDRFYMNFYVH